MAGIKLQKRENDFFVSYGHADLPRVTPLVDLLTRVCDLRVWFDGVQGNASTRSSELLGGAIRNSRGALFCLSEAWKRSTWCKGEYEVSLSEERNHPGFELVYLRLDDVEPPPWFNTTQILDLRRFEARAPAELLRSLSSDVPHRFDNADDVYVAAPWSRPSALTGEALDTLRGTGWRLVGDAPNLKHLGDERIAAIQRTTRGVVAVMPHDPSEPRTGTSPYIVEEARLAIALGKPLLLLAEPGVASPSELVSRAFQSRVFELTPGPAGRTALASVLDDFDSALERVAHDDTGAFIFLAASLLQDPADAQDVVSVAERASNMRCVRGHGLAGENAQTAIIDLIRRAAVVIADVSDDHRNTLIEAGIAMGCGTRLRLMCRVSGDALPRKAFMFEGQEIHLYRKPEERLGLYYRFARQFRRRIYVLH